MPDRILIVGVGFPKCGTTSLARSLQQDRRFLVPGTKELRYFNEGYTGNILDYIKLFPDRADGQFLVDITPSYISSSDAMKRIAALDLEKKIIVCLRNPTRRAYSHYIHDLYHHHALYDPSMPMYAGEPYERPYDLTFEEAFHAYPHISAHYFHGVRETIAMFGRQNVLVLTLENDFSERVFQQRLSEFLQTQIDCKPLRLHEGGTIPTIVRPDRPFRVVGENHDITLSPDHLYVFLSADHGIALWENCGPRADEILKASNKWTRHVSANAAWELSATSFSKDIERLSELLDADFSIWAKEPQPLEARQWVGAGPLKVMRKGVPASVVFD